MSVVDVCIVSTWTGGLGLSLPLMNATVIVKMFRVYRIFTLQRRIKPTMCSIYVAPVIYVLLMLSPCLVILALWTLVLDTCTRTNIDNNKYRTSWFHYGG